MRRILLLIGLAIMVAGASDLQAQITITPDGPGLPVGGTLVIKNGSVRTLTAVACINGQEILLGMVAPGGMLSIPIPNEPSLVGLKVTIKIFDQSGLLIEKTYELTG